MRRGEAVYFFTLVDLLLTTLFLGLVLFVTNQTSAAEQAATAEANAKQISDLKRVTGVSDLALLTDALTRLVPLHDARDAVEIVKQLGGPESARVLARLQVQLGGADSLRVKVQRLAAVEGAGRPHCLTTTDSRGEKTAIPIAHIVANDDGMTFTDSTDALDRVLTQLGLSFHSVRTLSFGAFSKAFAPLRQRPCAYTVRVLEKTNLKYPRQTLYGLFYTQFDKK